jgi:hypothetical protein
VKSGTTLYATSSGRLQCKGTEEALSFNVKKTRRLPAASFNVTEGTEEAVGFNVKETVSMQRKMRRLHAVPHQISLQL